VELLIGATVGKWVLPQGEPFLHQIFRVELHFLKAPSPKVTLQGGEGLSLIYEEGVRSVDSLYLAKSFYFKALGPKILLPSARITTANYTTTISGPSLSSRRLNPPKEFCGVLAKQLQIGEHEAVQYNRESNLIVLHIHGVLANLEDFSLPFAIKEGIKELNITFPTGRMIYYAILPASIDRLKFSYFNTERKEFSHLSIPIQVIDETVSTQTDIKPTEDKNKRLKIVIFLTLGGILGIVALLKRSLGALFLSLAAIAYGSYLLIPIKKVCIERGSKIYILPTKQSTIFEINRERRVYEELRRVNGYIKIKLSREKVGWVREEDSCKD